MKILGTVYIIAAASGTGKTSLSKALAESLDNIKISVSHTTRLIKPSESGDVNYFFVDTQKFEAMILANKFLEHAKVFGHYYGTTAEFVAKHINDGIDVILDIDWQGAQQIRQKIPGCVSIFLLPPSLKTLKERLEMRKRDDKNVIAERLKMASSEISHYNEFDYIVVNDDFATALNDLKIIVLAQRLRKNYQIGKHAKLLKELL